MKLAVRRIEPKCGWGNVAEGLCDGLREHGVQIVGHRDPAPAQLHILPPHFYEGAYEGQAAWTLSMWETDGCPEGLRAHFHNFDGIFVPTETNLAAYSEHHQNVHRINMGVDWKFWSPKPRKLDGTFRFLYTQHSPRRKGGDIAQAAGAKLLEQGYDIELVPAYALSDEEMRDLYWSSHAYLQPSRGEGWGMMPHQALATGMPAVISDCGGHKDYGWLPGCYLTKTNLTPSSLAFNGPPGDWWEPDLDDLVERMKWVVDNYAEALAAAQQSPELCRVNFDWTKIAGQVLDLLPLDDRAIGEWHVPTEAKFWVVPNSSLECDIGLSHYRFQKDEPVEVLWDVKRVLMKSGYVAA